MKITFNKHRSLDALAIILAEEFNLESDLNLDENLKALIAKASVLRKFTAKAEQKVTILLPYEDSMLQIILLGAGKIEGLNSLEAMNVGAKIIVGMKCVKLEKISVIVENRMLNHGSEVHADLAFGASLRNYSFDKYKSSDKLEGKLNIEQIEFVTDSFSQAEEVFVKELKPIAEAVCFSRDLISEPANIIYPESFANRAQKELADLDVKVEILDEKEMAKLGMNALLGVGQGSNRESKLLVMQYNGGDVKDAPLAFVGKGVTFDTGGISIKPSSNMEDMKYDMAGAGVVTGLVKALALRKAKVNIVAVAGLVENMPDGNAQRPSDVVRSMSGQTIEIINTDAEGRLVLADALWYTQDRFKPKLMIDLATLTGAIIIALGHHNAGLFSNDKLLAEELLQAGRSTGENLWELPLSKEYDKMVDSTIADLRNSTNGRAAGSITAAQFLQRFVNKVKWAHLDIAAVSWAEKDMALSPVGATAFGVRLLDNFVRKYEK